MSEEYVDQTPAPQMNSNVYFADAPASPDPEPSFPEDDISDNNVTPEPLS